MSLVNNVGGSAVLDDYDATRAYIDDMIDINARHLARLRTECLLTELLTQVEIRSTETKLVKLFGKQSVERQLAILNQNYNTPSPKLDKWLEIVGLNANLVEVNNFFLFLHDLIFRASIMNIFFLLKISL